MKKCIFTYSNFQINPQVIDYQKRVLDKFNIFEDVEHEHLTYNAPDPEVTPDQVIDFALQSLFYEKNYTNVLILDIDCIPLSSFAIDYTFNKSLHGSLVGNAQRSNHLDNNKHVFCGASCIAFSKETFEKMGKPSSTVTNRSDICEEFTWLCEGKNIPVEIYMPESYEQLPYDSTDPWPLADGMPHYGIGTTFKNSDDIPLFYHLFQSRLHQHLELFYNKCESLLT